MIFPLFFDEIEPMSLVSVDQVAVPARARSVIRRDPVEFSLIQGKAVEGWQSVPFKDWSATGRGYLRFIVKSPRDQVVQLCVMGAGMFYLNEEPRVGDVYSYGTFFVPVKLNSGKNEIIASADRGTVTLKFREPKSELEIGEFDATLPDFTGGKATSPYASFVVHNNSAEFKRVTLRSGATKASLAPRWLAPFSSSKIPVTLDVTKSTGEVSLFDGYTLAHSRSYTLESKSPSQSLRVTFPSKVDSSVQYYAVNLATKATGPRTPVVLSLHGASVEAIGQAQAYGPKEDFHLVAPTNRRPYGFNWEDIGRIDGLEALDHARSEFLNSKGDVFLTGHSMGGHGTWHLGAHYPNLFRAIAPCAGWISYDTYGGGANYDLSDPNQALLQRMNAPSHTLLLKENFRNYFGIYIHHGEADDVVSADQARTMFKELTPFGNVQMHLEPGAGHWFDNNPAPGADSVDWAPIFDLFRSFRPGRKPSQFTFKTVDPGINYELHGFQILRQQKPRELSKITFDRGALKTENARVLAFPPDHAVTSIDGQSVPKSKNHIYQNINGTWKSAPLTNPAEEAGLKGAFHQDSQFALVRRGPKDEQEAALRVARYLQEVSWYRANATPNLLLDPKPGVKAIRIGTPRTTGVRGPAKGELLLRRDRNGAMILASDVTTLDFAARFPFYTAGVALPDEMVATPELLTDGAKGIRRVLIQPR